MPLSRPAHQPVTPAVGQLVEGRKLMQASDVLEVVEREINGNWAISNAHGVDLKRCVLSIPEKVLFIDPSRGNSPIELWIVLEELPESKAGYKIVFDEKKQKFGLGITDSQTREKVFLGIYGSFLDTLAAM